MVAKPKTQKTRKVAQPKTKKIEYSWSVFEKYNGGWEPGGSVGNNLNLYLKSLHPDAKIMLVRHKNILTPAERGTYDYEQIW